MRALSDLIYGYDQLRRMMSYLRWSEGDADSIVPSLYAGRGRRTASDVDDTDEPCDTDDDTDFPSPATPSPNNGGAPFTE